MSALRLRQLVFASKDQNDIALLRHVLDLGHSFVDPGVAVFGLTNGVFALGDQFLEVVVPTEEDTAAGRFLDRSGGIGGYMAIFQTQDLTGVRERADTLGIRRVWDIDLEDISASHLHPADIGAAIVSVDEARPAQSWRWGGPDWEAQSRPGRLTALQVSCTDPQQLSARWGTVLGVKPRSGDHGSWRLTLDGGEVRFIPGDRDHLSTYSLTHPAPDLCLTRAQEAGLAVKGSSFWFAGVEVSIVRD